MHLGFEIFYTTPRQVDEMFCRVCGSLCEVKRDVYEPANFGMAQANISDLYDVFSCPHAGKSWHDKALKLVLAIQETPSKKMADLMLQDLKDLLKENGIQ
jgi:hypothetical protein